MTDYWVVIFRLRGSRYLKALESAKIAEEFCHFIFISSDNSGGVQEVLSTVFPRYDVINNLKPKVNDLEHYVCKELGVTSSIASLILTQSKMYEPTVLRNVQTLKLLGDVPITAKLVDKYLSTNFSLNLAYMYNYILFREGDYKTTIKLIYEHRDNANMLCYYMMKHIKVDIKYFKLILDGTLGLDNYISYANEHNINIKVLQKTLKLFNLVTLETLYIKLSLYESLLGQGIHDFIMKGVIK